MAERAYARPSRDGPSPGPLGLERVDDESSNVVRGILRLGTAMKFDHALDGLYARVQGARLDEGGGSFC